MKKHYQQLHTGSDRRGTATAELAVCLPVFVVLVMGAIECTSMIFVDQSLHVVAFEGVRTAIKPESTVTDATNRCNQVIAERELVGADVQFTPNDFSAITRGTPITIRVTAPTSSNAIIPLKFFSGDLEATAVMIRE